MSILIKGIDMPKDGDRIYLLIEGDKCFNALDPIQTLAEAIQIPKGHGRLIDGDELKTLFKGDAELDTYTAFHFLYAIDEAPTILDEEGK